MFSGVQVQMPVYPEWSDIAVRVLCTLLAGAAFGFDRGEHAHPAGLRTAILVSLAACLAMIQTNILLATAGKSASSFVNIDVMRLPLGVLSGIGFIGAGAIMRRENHVLGITTAAILWFLTVLGLCFGGGQIALGLLGLALGMLAVTVLRRVETRMTQDHEATLTVVTTPLGPTGDLIRATLRGSQYQIISCGAVYSPTEQTRELICEIKWRTTPSDTQIPESVRTLSDQSGMTKVCWSPHSR